MPLRRPDANTKTVYSTDPAASERVEPASAVPHKAAGDAKPKMARMRLEKKGRAGKAVTVVAGVTGSPELLKDLAKELKAICGAGGTIKGGGPSAEIEVQGDHREKIEARLAELGYLVKRVGG